MYDELAQLYELRPELPVPSPYETGQEAFAMPPTAPPVVQMPNQTPPVAPPYNLQGQVQAPDNNMGGYAQALQSGYSPADNPLNTKEINDLDVKLYKKYANTLLNEDKPSGVHNIAEAIAGHYRGGLLGALAGSVAAMTDKHEVDRATALKGLNEIAQKVNWANIKPMTSVMQDRRKQFEQAIRKERNDNLKAHGEAMIQAKNWTTAENVRHHNMVNDIALQSLGLKRDQFDKAFQQRNDFFGRHEKRMRDMANLQTAVKMYGYRQDWALGLAKLRQQDVDEYGKMKMEEAKINSEVSRKFAEAAAKGQPLLGANGQPLNPEDVMVHYERQPLEEPQMTDDEGITQALADANQGQPTEQPANTDSAKTGAAATTGVKLPPAQRANFQRLVGSGMNPEKAKALFIQSAVDHGHTLEQAMEMARGL